MNTDKNESTSLNGLVNSPNPEFTKGANYMEKTIDDKITTVFCIFDGFGMLEKSPNNCIALAKMPHFQNLLKTSFWTTLNADGISVGQEEGLVGNSEVGHMNLGGLQLVSQLSYQITQSSLYNFKLDKSRAVDQLINPSEILQKFKTVHLVGLFSTGTIHSDMRHWAGAVRNALESKVSNIYLHLITDGRDSDRRSFLESLETFKLMFTLEEQEKIQIGSVGGRAYAMDRDNNFEKVFYGMQAMFGESLIKKTDELRKQYDISDFKTATHSDKTISLHDAVETLNNYISDSYTNSIYDEFIEPIGYKPIVEGDCIWLINFRADRMRQIIKLLTDYNCDQKNKILAMNDYGIGETGYSYIFKSQPVVNNFAYYAQKLNKSQLHTAETEKYNHVTYFFNGGKSEKEKDEEWILIPSNKLTNHSEKPEMKAKEVLDVVIDGLGKYNYIVVNFANPDMVGHCGDIKAGIESMEFLDLQLGRILKALKSGNHNMLLTADHGNMEFVGPYKSKGKDLTDTEHNPSPVPMIIVNHDIELLKGKLKKLTDEYNFAVDKNLLEKVLNQDNLLTDTELTKDEIPSPDLPLWYAGLLVLALNS